MPTDEPTKTRPGDQPLRLRVGRRVPIHLYQQTGPDPSDDDPPAGTMLTAELAAHAAAAVNGQPPPTGPEIERLRAELWTALRAASDAEDARDEMNERKHAAITRAQQAEATANDLRQRVQGLEASGNELLGKLEAAEIELADWRLARSKLSRWWDWPLVQWWWYRQYRRRDRKAFRRECDEIRARDGGE